MDTEAFPELNLIIALLGGLVLVLGLFSQRLNASPFPPVLIALASGIIIGPHALGLLDLADLAARSSIIEYAARLTLAIGLFGVALRIGAEYPRRHWRDVAVLVGLGMPIMWFVSSTLVYLILDLPLWMSVLIGAIITPTDPIASTPIVTGKLSESIIPERMRHAISSESGANDGLAYLFVLLPILVMTRSTGDALSHWITRTLMWEVVTATLIGIVIGLVAAKLLQFSEKRDLIAPEWRLIYTVSLALLTAGLGRIIGTDEVVLVFAAGIAFTQLLTTEEREEEDLGQEAVNRFFSVPIFALFGMAIPWEGWRALGWSGLLLAVAIMFLRRLPAILLLRPLLRGVHGAKEALFIGWFGPIAVAAMYYSSLAEHRLGETIVWDVVSLVIFASVLSHGLTADPFTRLFGRSIATAPAPEQTTTYTVQASATERGRTGRRSR
ncbi:MAG: cation:proton antiporter [Acidobacteria bacterium]|nr:cation:proton antiporter [Acidobacteriota bacterium]